MVSLPAVCPPAVWCDGQVLQWEPESHIWGGSAIDEMLCQIERRRWGSERAEGCTRGQQLEASYPSRIACMSQALQRVWGSPAVIGASESANRLRRAEQRSGSVKDGVSMDAPRLPGSQPAVHPRPHLCVASASASAASSSSLALAAPVAISHTRRRDTVNPTGE